MKKLKISNLAVVIFFFFMPLLLNSQTITNKEKLQNSIKNILASAPKGSQINNTSYPQRSKQLLLDLRNTLQTVSESMGRAKTNQEALKGLFIKLNSLTKSVIEDVVIMQKDIGGTPQEQEQWAKCTEFLDACLRYKCGTTLEDGSVNLECFYGCQAEAIACEKRAIITAFSNVGGVSGTATQKQ